MTIFPYFCRHPQKPWKVEEDRIKDDGVCVRKRNSVRAKRLTDELKLRLSKAVGDPIKSNNKQKSRKTNEM